MQLNAIKIDTYLKRLSSSSPTPGGGSASALVAAVGVGLAEMVAQVILGRKKQVPKVAQLKMASKKLAQFRVKIEEIIDQDAKIYARLHKAYANKGAVKEGHIADCLYESFDVMVLLASLISAALQEVVKLEKYKGNSLMNDLLLSKEFLNASFKGAYETAKINCDFMPDKKRKQTMSGLLKVVRFKFKEATKKSGAGKT